MSVARAFTRRVKRPEVQTGSAQAPGRAATIRKPGQKIDRAQISLPVTLISTTNMLSYNAPDIASLNVDMPRKASAASSTASLSSSDESVGSRSSADSSGTMTDASSVASSPHSPVVSHNHLTTYFKATQSDGSPKFLESPKLGSPVRCESSFFSLLSTAATSTAPSTAPAPAPTTTPAPAPLAMPVSSPPIPSRAVSHSKRAHENSARTRSELSRSSTVSSNNSTASRSAMRIRPSAEALRKAGEADEADHPFGKELEQLNEIAEGFGDAVTEVTREEDVAAMQEKQLLKFSVADYLKEIAPLFSGVFEGCAAPSRVDWI